MNIEDIYELIKEQQKVHNTRESYLMELVKESATATSAANELNRDLKSALSGVKKKNWFDVLAQLGGNLFYFLLIIILIIALLSGRNVKLPGGIEVSTPNTTVSTST